MAAYNREDSNVLTAKFRFDNGFVEYWTVGTDDYSRYAITAGSDKQLLESYGLDYVFFQYEFSEEISEALRRAAACEEFVKEPKQDENDDKIYPRQNFGGDEILEERQ